MHTDAELVIAARTGEAEAFATLVERWTNRCWDIAWRILHDRELAADVAQETLFTAWRQLDRLERPESFGGWVSRIARNRALDRLERERRAVPTGDHDALEAAAMGVAAGTASVGDPVVALDSVQQQDLVWAAAAALGERDASVLDLHLRHGLEPAELAEELGIAPNNAHQVLFRLRKRLGGAIRAWLLWRGGRPRCDRLAGDLRAAAVEVFGADAVRVIDAHASGCLGCDRERAEVAAPAAMFAAVPVAAMPAALSAQVLAGLRDAGVPVPAGGLPVDAAGAGGSAEASGGASAEAVGDGSGASGGGASAEAGGDFGASGGGASAEAGGDGSGASGGGASAEAVGGASAEAVGGAPAEAGGDHAEPADAESASNPDPSAGDAATSANDAPKSGPWTTKTLVGSSAVLTAIAVWLLVWGPAPAADEAALPGPAAAAPSAPAADDTVPLEEEPIAQVAPIPPGPGGQDDPSVVPVVPAAPWVSAGDPGEAEDTPAAPEDHDPPATSQPPSEDTGNGGSGDGNGNGGDPGNGGDGGDGGDGGNGGSGGNGNGGDDEDPPEIGGFRVSSGRNVFRCPAAGQGDGAQPIRATWVTSGASDVELRTPGGLVFGGLEPDAEDVWFCVEDGSETFTLVATGPGGTVVREASL